MMNIQQYLREVTPINILDVFDPSALDNFLNGYSFALGSGITVIYTSIVPAKAETLRRRDALGSEFRRAFNPLCKNWRDPDGCQEEQSCIQADNERALAYINNTCSSPRLYRCQPLGLWDMTFPLGIGEQIVGILFGGQIIVEDVLVNWREVLREYDAIVDWETCPDQDSHYRAIQQNITKRFHSRARTRKLSDILSEASQPVQKISNVEDLKKRIDDFLRFGRTTQQLIDELHKARKTAAEHQILHNCDEELSSIDLAEPAQWWQECGQLMNTLTTLPEIEAIHIYVRKHSRYSCEVAEPDGQGEPESILAREVISAFPAGQLELISETEHRELLVKIGLGFENIWGYRDETGTGYEICSTLVVLRGDVSQERCSFLADLFSVICTDANVANLIFRERDADVQYRRKVGLIGHSFRTPLQSLQFDLEDLENTSRISTSPELLEKVKNGLARLQDAREDLLLLLDSAVQETETFDLVEVLLYVLNSMEVIAKKHPCIIIRQGTWPDKIPIQGIRYEVQRALTCLLDNAIKYSYHGQRRDEGGLYQVRVWIASEDGYGKIILRNYGIGIPENKLHALREYGIRGNVADKKKTRLGTGLGLPFAIGIFEKWGGWIHLTSLPADSATEEEKDNYHRYITTVEASLPIARRK